MTAEAEADIEEGDEGAAPAKKKGLRLSLPKLSKKLLIIIAAALIVMVAGGAALFLFVLPKPAPVEESAHVEAPPPSFIFNLPPMTVNLRNEGNEPDQFMKLTVAVEVANQGVMEEIQPRMAKVVDAFQVYLRELRKSDLEGSAGIYRLKEELRRRVNLAIYPAQIDSILFKEILVQ